MAEHSTEQLFVSASLTIRLAVLPLTVAKMERMGDSPRKAQRSNSRYRRASRDLLEVIHAKRRVETFSSVLSSTSFLSSKNRRSMRHGSSLTVLPQLHLSSAAAPILSAHSASTPSAATAYFSRSHWSAAFISWIFIKFYSLYHKLLIWGLYFLR